MSGSTFGKLFKVTTWGESHGKAIGVVIDGCPAGIEINEEIIQKDLDRRKPGNSPFATKRMEDDENEILSGVFEGKTTGTPISIMIRNKDHRSKDYGNISNVFRPGHADYTYNQKYGFRDHRGGGRSSGRETAARVCAGAIAKAILRHFNIEIFAYTLSIGNISINKEKANLNERLNNSLAMPDREAYEKASIHLEKAMADTDSVGGVVECIITGMKPGIGQPVFDKLDASLAKAIFSIGAVKGFEIGSGFSASLLKGSEHNDSFYFNGEKIVKETNNAGGILGGISDGDDIIFRAAFKPTASIAKAQNTVDINNENIEIKIEGRHDPIIVPRAVIVVEAMAAITLVDLIFQNRCSKISDF